MRARNKKKKGRNRSVSSVRPSRRCREDLLLKSWKKEMVHLIKRRIGREGSGRGLLFVSDSEEGMEREGPSPFPLLWLG